MEKKQITDIGIQMLKKQTELADQYHYKQQPPLIGAVNRDMYFKNLPQGIFNCVREIKHTDKGMIIVTEKFPVYSREGTKIADSFDSIVIGDYGAFLEINDKDMIKSSIKVKEGQEYRINNPKYSEHVKYQWFTPKDTTDAKLYYQQKGVTYADYMPGKWYVSPYEILDREEFKKLQIEIFTMSVDWKEKTVLGLKGLLEELVPLIFEHPRAYKQFQDNPELYSELAKQCSDYILKHTVPDYLTPNYNALDISSYFKDDEMER